MYQKTNKKYFKVIRELEPSEIREVVSKQKTTQHLLERANRAEAYIKQGLMSNDFISGFEVDKNHPNGNEFHIITPEGVIKIYNARTLKLITFKGARGKQIKDLYNNQVPRELKWLVKMCYDRQTNNPVHEL